MSEQGRRFYWFGEFCLDTREQKLLKDGVPVRLTGRPFDVLKYLVENAGRVLPRERIVEAVWSTEVRVEDQTVDVHITKVRKALGDAYKEPKYILTVPGGYKFIAELRDSSQTEVANPEQYTPQTDHRPYLRQSILWFSLVAATLYASLYAVESIVEVAYGFSEYGGAGMKLALLTFGYIFLSSSAGLAVDCKLVGRDWKLALPVTISIFVLAAAGVFIISREFLPPAPITRLSTPAHTAQAAYLKTTYYSLFMAIFFLVLPFHFIAAIRRKLRVDPQLFTNRQTQLAIRLGIPVAAIIYWRLWLLGALFVLVGVLGLFLHFDLMDKLMTVPGKNLFELLIYVRLALYFSVGVLGLTWYFWALNKLRGAYLDLESGSMLPQRSN